MSLQCNRRELRKHLFVIWYGEYHYWLVNKVPEHSEKGVGVPVPEILRGHYRAKDDKLGLERKRRISSVRRVVCVRMNEKFYMG